MCVTACVSLGVCVCVFVFVRDSRSSETKESFLKCLPSFIHVSSEALLVIHSGSY